MAKTSVYLDAEDLRALREVSKLRATSQSRLIREAIRQYTSSRRRPLLEGLGMFDSGCTDTSARRKEILKEAALSGTRRAKIRTVR
jgi:hypothetical protein